MATNILHDSILMRSDLIVFSARWRAGAEKGASGGSFGRTKNFFCRIFCGTFGIVSLLEVNGLRQFDGDFGIKLTSLQPPRNIPTFRKANRRTRLKTKGCKKFFSADK